MKISVIVLGLAVAGLACTEAAPVRVACVGDSITAGAKIKDPARDGYPARLGEILGAGYEVRNFGVSGATMLKQGNNPYWGKPQFRAATTFAPNIVVLMLGTNDSKPVNWDAHQSEFRADYEAMVAHFAALPSRPKIFVCLPPPSLRKESPGDPKLIRESAIRPVRTSVKEVAASQNLTVIDLFAPFEGHSDWLPDGVHPDGSGATAMAKVVAQAIRP